MDCSELTWVFDKEVKPMLEEVLRYGGLFCFCCYYYYYYYY